MEKPLIQRQQRFIWLIGTQAAHICNTLFPKLHQSPNKPITEYKTLNTALVLGFKPNSRSLKIQMKAKIHDRTSTRSAPWQNDEWILIGSSEHSNETIEGGTSSCNNCGRGHHVNDCDWPYYAKNCSNCLVVSNNGGDHNNPCNRVNKISPFRLSILSINAVALFELVYPQLATID